jgi:hypothetical protein
VSLFTEPTGRDHFAHVFTANPGKCRACGRDLQITQWRGRHVERGDGCHILVMRDRRCPDTACPGRAEVRRAPDEHRFALKKDIYGLDIAFEIVDRRLREDLTFEEIQRRLAARGVGICLRSVCNVFRRFAPLLDRRTTERRAGVVLIDLIRYEERPVLHLAIDATSRRVLLAERHETPTIGAFLGRLQGLEAESFVTDECLGPAVRATFPGVPHELFQTHFLRRSPETAHSAPGVAHVSERLSRIRLALAMTEESGETASTVAEDLTGVREHMGSYANECSFLS